MDMVWLADGVHVVLRPHFACEVISRRHSLSPAFDPGKYLLTKLVTKMAVPAKDELNRDKFKPISSSLSVRSVAPDSLEYH